MAENTNPILLSFGYGQEANLPVEYTQGKIYITTDTKRMYVDLPGATDRLCLSNFEMVTTLPSTSELKQGEANQFYVKKTTSEDNVVTYSLHCYDNGWKEVINVVELEKAIAALDGRLTAVEGRLDTYDSNWATLPDTYVNTSGDTMTGALEMSDNQITGLASGGAVDTNAANIGDVKTAVNAHAAVKATGTVLGHVTLSDAINSTSDASKGIAATPGAVKSAYDLASQAKSAAEQTDGKLANYVLKEYAKTDEDGNAQYQLIKSNLNINGEMKFSGGTGLNVNGYKLFGLKDPSGNTDAAHKKYVDDTATGAKNSAISTVTGTKASTDTDETAPTLYDLKYEIEALESEDIELDDRLDAIEAVIDGVTGAMHFIGQSTTNPITVGETAGVVTINGTVITTFINGDVIIYNYKEFVYSNGAWVELGDVTQEAQRIGDLEEEIYNSTDGLKVRMTAAENAIDALESKDEDLEGRVKALEDWRDDTVNPTLDDHETRISTLEGTVGTKPTGAPNLGDNLWDEVAALRTDLGKKDDTKDINGSAFARIAALKDENITQNSAIVGLGAQLTWSAF